MRFILLTLLFSSAVGFAHTSRPCDHHILHSLKGVKLQGWLPLESLLENLPQDVSGWDSLPIHGRLGMFVNVGTISGEDSQGLAHQLAQKSKHDVKSYPMWPSSHADLKNGVSFMTANKLRINIVTEAGKAEIIEGMLFQDGAWVPFLYEYDETSKKFVRILASRNGIHSVSKCTSCHGAGADFSPIPFKNKDYRPSRGWFFSQNPESFTTRNLTTEWAVSDHDSLLESILKPH